TRRPARRSPAPVAPTDPYRSTSTATTDDARSPSSSTNRFAARIGPTVWELDGPTPIEKRSKTLTVIGIRYRIAIGWNLRTGPDEHRRARYLRYSRRGD